MISYRSASLVPIKRAASLSGLRSTRLRAKERSLAERVSSLTAQLKQLVRLVRNRGMGRWHEASAPAYALPDAIICDICS